MSGIGDHSFHTCVWYRRDIVIPKEWSGRRILLHFCAVDYRAAVWINGILVATHEGGHTPFNCDITNALRHGSIFQSVAVVNYPNEHAYTRITEFKYLTGQSHTGTSMVYEYPQAEGDPYYPVPRKENQDFYSKYQTLAGACPRTHFVGRLATYKYYNMDQVVAQALTLCARITGSARRDVSGVGEVIPPSITRPDLAAA